MPPNLATYLEIKFVDWGDDFLVASMPVNSKTHQPWGILHGGASVVLAETIGSYASTLVINTEKFYAVGLEVNANHIRPVSTGFVRAVCVPIHIGEKTHVWDIKIMNEAEKIVCVSRLTVAIIQKRL